MTLLTRLSNSTTIGNPTVKRQEMKAGNKFQSCSCTSKFIFLPQRNSVSSPCLCVMCTCHVCDVFGKNVTTLETADSVKPCYSLQMQSDSVVKEQKKAICSLKILSLLLVFDKASLSWSCSYFQWDDGVYQTDSAVMAATLTRATCLGST